MLRSLFAWLAGGLVAVAAADTLVIGPDGPWTIQQAITLSAPGDTVALRDGVYTGPGNRDVTFGGRAVTVRSLSGDPAACVIDCQGTPQENHRAFLFVDHEGLDTVVEGLTITGGYMAASGGGLECALGYPTIRNCRFVGNVSTGDGGGLRTGGPSLVQDCWFEGNEAIGGGGAATTMSWGEVAVFERCTFVANVAGNWGGGHRT